MPSRRSSDDRRTVILGAAARLFSERGYPAVGMDEIGDVVGVSGPSLYWHFPTKQALLDAVIIATMQRFADGYEAVAAATPDLSFEQVVEVGVDLVLDQPDRFRTLMLERRRLGSHHDEYAAAEARNTVIGRAALGRLNPALEDDRAGLRLFIHLGPLLALARDRPPIPRSRLRELATRSIVALAAAPPRPPGADAPATGQWQPVRSRPVAILHAARQLFRSHGFEGVSLNDIGNAAGLSRPSVYHYYSGKAEILDEAWRREMMRLTVGAWTALETASSAEDALDRLAASYVAVVLDCLDILDVFHRRPLDGPDLDGPRRSLRHHVLDAWITVLAELHPELDDAATHVVTEMAFGAAAQAALAFGGDHRWHDEIVSLMTAVARR